MKGPEMKLTLGAALLALSPFAAAQAAESQDAAAQAAEQAASQEGATEKAFDFDEYYDWCTTKVGEFVVDADPTEEVPYIMKYRFEFKGDPMDFMQEGIEGQPVRTVRT